jgi:hypothetical protein
MLKRLSTKDFSVFTQELSEIKDGDEYNRLKKIKQRATVVNFFNRVLPHKEVIVSWLEDSKPFSATAIWSTEGYNNLDQLPDPPVAWDEINGNQKPAQKHIVFYAAPSMEIILLEIDTIESIVVTNIGLDDLLKD